LRKSPEIQPVLTWFFRSVPFGPTGKPGPAPEWPRPGGLAEQDPQIVEAYDILRFELPHVGRPGARPPEATPAPEKPPMVRSH
jgi:hypothetical protein